MGSAEVTAPISLVEASLSSPEDELKGASNPSGIFSGGGANGDVFSNMWRPDSKCERLSVACIAKE